MKISNLLIGCIFIIGSIFFLKDELLNFKIQQKGKWVKAEIIELPKSCLGTKAKWFMKVRFQGRIVSKQIPGGYCEGHNVGDQITVKYLSGVDRVLLPEDGFIFEYFSIAALCFFGIYAIYLGKKRK